MIDEKYIKNELMRYEIEKNLFEWWYNSLIFHQIVPLFYIETGMIDEKYIKNELMRLVTERK